MTSWIHAVFTFFALGSAAAVSVVFLGIYRENRYVAPVFFVLSVAFALLAIPAFFGVGLLT